MKFVVHSRTRLNNTGWLGAALLIIGPLAAAFSLVMFMNAPHFPSGNGPAQAWAMVSALASTLPFIGYVMFSIGKETTSHAVSDDDD
ncbi:hypothetical protein [Brucella sp. 2280]|uniref:hypothetical protein n=1 Tax=Brucella sp. 2280 TaxID=2592625 RepID=UPI001296114F|nr:hypothetical protein [Brucella sp. 2280]QGA55857.1 hypothetical protein GHC20_01640 [Brucella sp. 2280]